MYKKNSKSLEKNEEKTSDARETQAVIEISDSKSKDIESATRSMAYAFSLIRERSGMSRKEFSEWLGIPYRTMQEWELGRRTMPDYVLNLIEYKVDNEIVKKK